MSDQDVQHDVWVSTTLGALGKYLNGRAFKSSEWSTTGRPIIRIQDLTGSNTNPNYFEGAVEDRYVVRHGDLLISWSATLGAYIWDGPEGVLNQHIFKVESGINKRFHYHLVRERIAELQRNAHGSGMVHVTKGIFDSTPVAIPGDERLQEAIAKIIDSTESKRLSSEQHIAKARRAIAGFREAVLGSACSGRLTRHWRDEHPVSASASDLIALSREEVAKRAFRSPPADAFSEPMWLELPPKWGWAPLRDLALIRGGIQKQPKRAPKDNAYRYLRVANVLRGRLDLSNLAKFELFQGELETFRLEKGDVLIVEGNGSSSEIGRSAVWSGEIEDCVHQNHIIRVRCILMDPRFLDLFWNSPVAAREIASLAVTSSGLYSLSTTKIGSVSIPVAPLEEQREVVRRTDELFALTAKIAARIDGAERHLHRSSQAMLGKAFRGELIVTRD